MVIEPTNQASSSVQSKPEKEVTPDAVKGSNVNNEGIPEAGKTSDVGPAVVPNISSSTLETSRAVNAPEQTAEESKADSIVEAQDKEQLKKAEGSAPKGAEPPQKSLVDTSV